MEGFNLCSCVAILNEIFRKGFLSKHLFLDDDVEDEANHKYEGMGKWIGFV